MVNNASRPTTRPSLLLRLRDPRDAEAWYNFIAVYRPLICGECRRRGLPHHDAEDVTQKVLLRVLGGVRGFDYRPERGRFCHWLGTVVRNEVFRHRKGIRGSAGAGGLDQAPAPAEAAAWTDSFNERLLQAALQKAQPHFEAATWRAFEMVWILDRPAAEVAGKLSRPLDWVYVAKSRVLTKVREEVERLADDAALPGAARP